MREVPSAMAQRQWIQTRNAAVAAQLRCQAAASRRGAQVRLKTYGLERWVSVRPVERKAVGTEDAAARQVAGQLDGCYVVLSALPAAVATTLQVHEPPGAQAGAGARKDGWRRWD